MKKHIIAALSVLIIVFIFTALSTEAASNTNADADVAYMTKVNEIKAESKSVYYKFVDMTGDGLHEAMIIGKTIYGSGYSWDIFDYANGYARLIFRGGAYGVDKIVVYKKTKCLYYHRAGHGLDAEFYYQFKNGRYNHMATKSRQQMPGSSWSYNDSSKIISKSKYNSIINKLKKGSSQKYNPWSWTKKY